MTQARRALSIAAWRARFAWPTVFAAVVILVVAAAVLRSCVAVASCNELADDADRLARDELEWRHSLARLAYGAEDLAAEFTVAQGVTWGLADEADSLATRTEYWRGEYVRWIDELGSWKEELERRASQDERDERWVAELERIDAEVEFWADENDVSGEWVRIVLQDRRERAAITRFASFGADETQSTVDGEDMDAADLRLTADGLRTAATHGRLGCRQ